MDRDRADSYFVGRVGHWIERTRVADSVGRVCEPCGSYEHAGAGDVAPRSLPVAQVAQVARTHDDETIRLYERAARRLRERAVLVDPLRVCAAVLDRMDALSRAREPVADCRGSFDAAIGGTVEDWIDAAIDGLLEDERGARTYERAGENAFFGDVFGLTHDTSECAAAAFHALDFPTRAAFCALLVENRTLDECERDRLGARDDLARCARVALRTILLGKQPDSPR